MPTLTGEMRRAPIGNTPFDDPGGVDKGIGWGACLDQFLDEVAVARALAAIDVPHIGHEDFEDEREAAAVAAAATGSGRGRQGT
eukprot:4050063-Alexandrium_andersonii.AAC.1